MSANEHAQQTIDQAHREIRGASPASGPGTCYALSLGFNYQRNANVLIRPEIRWDCFDADSVAAIQPLGNGGNSNQFMAAVDCVLSF